MKIQTKLLIIFSFLVLIGLVFSQFLIINNSTKIDKKNIKNEEKLRELTNENFKNKVTLALTKVRDKLISNIKESNIYLDPVKQIQEDYFVVSFYDKIDKDQLKPIINEEFNHF